MTEVAVEHAGLRLAGTACIPCPGRQPTVLLIPGSGPLDRDENSAGQRLDVFNTIAAELARIGWASVRYDKRGCGASTGDFSSAGLHDLVTDAVAWLDWIAAAPFAGPIYLLGHSEGCLVAPLAGARRRIDGAILLCPTATPMEAVLMQQAAQIARELSSLRGVSGWLTRRLAGDPVATQRRLIEAVRATPRDTLRFRGKRLGAKWLRELLGLDVEALFRAVDYPLLVIGGGKDLQCDPEDAARIAALARGPVEHHVVPDLAHVLRCDPGTPSILGAAALLARPVEPRVLALVTAWASARTEAMPSTGS